MYDIWLADLQFKENNTDFSEMWISRFLDPTANVLSIVLLVTEFVLRRSF